MLKDLCVPTYKFRAKSFAERRMAMRLYGLGYSLSGDDGSVAASSGFSCGFFSLGLVSKI